MKKSQFIVTVEHKDDVPQPIMAGILFAVIGRAAITREIKSAREIKSVRVDVQDTSVPLRLGGKKPSAVKKS